MWFRKIGLGAFIIILAALGVVAFGMKLGIPMKLELNHVLSLESGTPASSPASAQPPLHPRKPSRSG